MSPLSRRKFAASCCKGWFEPKSRIKDKTRNASFKVAPFEKFDRGGRAACVSWPVFRGFTGKFYAHQNTAGRHSINVRTQDKIEETPAF
jgi:hypothetical protein